MYQIVIVAYGDGAIQDIEALEGNAPGNATTQGFKAGTTTTFRVTKRAYDSRVGAQLETLASQRVLLLDGLTDAKRTRPLITYTVTEVAKPDVRIDQINGAISYAVAAPPNVTLKGANLICGLKAVGTVGSGVSLLTVTAVDKGPGGNKHRVVLKAGNATSSVVTTIGQDGDVTITVTPTVAQRADLIAAQINANALAAAFVVATGGGTGKVFCPQTVILSGGEGDGIADRLFPSVLATSWLRVRANAPGNEYNGISIKIVAPAGAGSVVQTGTGLTSLFTVTPAAGVITVSAIAAQINANAAAAALITATAVGVSNLSPSAFGPKFLYFGSGLTVVATIGGAPATVVSYTDVQIVVSATAAALLAAGLVAGEVGLFNLRGSFGKLEVQLTTV